MINNQDNLLKINTEELSIEENTIDKLVDLYKNELIKKNILCDTTNINGSRIKTHSNFNDDTWAIFQDLQQGYRYLKYNRLNSFEFNNITNQEIQLIKCWISQKLLDNYIIFTPEDNSISSCRVSASTILNLSFLIDFIIKSNNFSLDFLDIIKGDRVEDFFNDIADKRSLLMMHKSISYIFDYLDFCINTVMVTPDTTLNREYLKYYKKILPMKEQVYGRHIPQKKLKNYLPSSENVLLFDYYINKFFNDNHISDTLKQYYKPLLIWWKISNIIPIRPSEFCSKIKRDCLSMEGDNLFIEINRSKKKKKRGSLPAYTKFKINKEYYDLISEYILETDKYGETETLISCPSIIFLRQQLSNISPLFLVQDVPKEFKNNSVKIFDKYVNYNLLNDLLKSFYEKIIDNYFGDTLITQRIKLNDTRHFAFTGLVLQGIPIVEIAMIGGHSDTESIDYYSYETNSYINTSVFTSLNKTLAHYKINKIRIENIVYNMPKECPCSLDKCTDTEFFGIHLGCCTTSSEYSCESYDCYNCSHWYCSPTIENFKSLCEIIQIDLNERTKILKSDINFLVKLFAESNSIVSKLSDSELAFNRDTYIKMQELSNKISSDTNEIIEIKSKLLKGILSYEDDELDIIRKLKILNDSFNNETKFLN